MVIVPLFLAQTAQKSVQMQIALLTCRQYATQRHVKSAVQIAL